MASGSCELFIAPLYSFHNAASLPFSNMCPSSWPGDFFLTKLGILDGIKKCEMRKSEEMTARSMMPATEKLRGFNSVCTRCDKILHCERLVSCEPIMVIEYYNRSLSHLVSEFLFSDKSQLGNVVLTSCHNIV